MDEIIKKARKLIEQDKIESAIITLQKVNTDSELSHFLSRIRGLEKKYNQGVIDYNTFSLQKNQLRFSILDYLEKLGSGKFELNKQSKTISISGFNISPRSIFLFVLGILILIIIGISFSKKSAVGIKGNNNDNNRVEINQ